MTHTKQYEPFSRSVMSDSQLSRCGFEAESVKDDWSAFLYQTSCQAIEDHPRSQVVSSGQLRHTETFTLNITGDRARVYVPVSDECLHSPLDDSDYSQQHGAAGPWRHATSSAQRVFNPIATHTIRNKLLERVRSPHPMPTMSIMTLYTRDGSEANQSQGSPAARSAQCENS